MVMCNSWPIGLCSWSVVNDPDRLRRLKDECQVEHIHLHLLSDPNKRDSLISAIQEQGWTPSCTMVKFDQENYSTLETIRKTGGIVPDDCWPANRDRVLEGIRKTRQLNVPYLSTHFGFLPHESGPARDTFMQRTRELAEAAAQQKITLLMETGQETAEDLRTFLQELNCPALGVNFDPANMILYDNDNPIEALDILAPWIGHIHIKDAVRTEKKGTWGREALWGTGQVDVKRFLDKLHAIHYQGALAIEREAGDQQTDDIIQTIQYLQHYRA